MRAKCAMYNSTSIKIELKTKIATTTTKKWASEKPQRN